MIETPIRVLAWLFARAYRTYFSTLDTTVLLPDGSSTTLAAYPFGADVFALSEQDTAALGGILAGRRFTVLVAHGRDGDWVARAVESLGGTTIRGSSRRGGVEALVALIRDRQTPCGPAALVVDGPLGPLGVAKAGAAVLATKTGVPIWVVAAAARRQLTLTRTWAQIYIPLPFTRVVIALESITAGGAADAERAEQVTRAVARARHRAHDAIVTAGRRIAHSEGAREC